MAIKSIDATCDYEPSNCRWITQAENARRAARKDKNDKTGVV